MKYLAVDLDIGNAPYGGGIDGYGLDALPHLVGRQGLCKGDTASVLYAVTCGELPEGKVGRTVVIEKCAAAEAALVTLKARQSVGMVAPVEQVGA